jgi:hypothetical protein
VHPSYALICARTERFDDRATIAPRARKLIKFDLLSIADGEAIVVCSLENVA